jgi:hypothetical protein
MICVACRVCVCVCVCVCVGRSGYQLVRGAAARRRAGGRRRGAQGHGVRARVDTVCAPRAGVRTCMRVLLFNRTHLRQEAADECVARAVGVDERLGRDLDDRVEAHLLLVVCV